MSEAIAMAIKKRSYPFHLLSPHYPVFTIRFQISLVSPLPSVLKGKVSPFILMTGVTIDNHPSPLMTPITHPHRLSLESRWTAELPKAGGRSGSASLGHDLLRCRCFLKRRLPFSGPPGGFGLADFPTR
ncbi:hypothetical protein HNY73_022896 [Argiope bruennichi]|uniref:Uncharacterized protein n=1 Tax=Argiope bruennichi TaxID=94029 RepID=A0A8T0E3E1_ARGBR|nr:hypothetical protein HNY73_022896 [Argiope bruennichi]